MTDARLHARHVHTTRARSRLTELLIDWRREWELTDRELVFLLSEGLTSYLGTLVRRSRKYGRRKEERGT